MSAPRGSLEDRLRAASAAGDAAAVERYLSAGADPNAKDAAGHSCFTLACLRGHAAIVDRLLKDPRVDVGSVDAVGYNALCLAARYDPRGASVDLLLADARTDVNHSGADGWTPLMLAAFYEPTGAVAEKILRHRRTDVNAANRSGNTALILAAQQGHARALAALLRRHDADLNARNSHGNTALVMACVNGRTEAVALLARDPRVDLNLANGYGKTAADYASPALRPVLQAATDERRRREAQAAAERAAAERAYREKLAEEARRLEAERARAELERQRREAEIDAERRRREAEIESDRRRREAELDAERRRAEVERQKKEAEAEAARRLRAEQEAAALAAKRLRDEQEAAAAAALRRRAEEEAAAAAALQRRQTETELLERQLRLRQREEEAARAAAAEIARKEALARRLREHEEGQLRLRREAEAAEARRRREEEERAHKLREEEERLRLELRQQEVAVLAEQVRLQEKLAALQLLQVEGGKSTGAAGKPGSEGTLGGSSGSIGSASSSGVSKLRVDASDVAMTDRVLGEGAFGIVREGVLRGSTRVAVKTIKAGMAMDAEVMKAFVAEVRVWEGLNQKNILPLLAYCESPPMMISEIVRGGNLRSHMTKLGWPIDRGLRLLTDVAAGMAFLHSFSVLHGDLKSLNILVDRDTAKIADFGLARVREAMARTTASAGVSGTVGFLAPERYEGILKHPADVYAFSMCMYEVVSGGKFPFEGMLPIAVIKKVCYDRERPPRPEGTPDRAWGLMERAWAQDPAARPGFVEVRDEMEMWEE
ncbi:kinase-like domain-containing protein [Hyaloraphidium curvatum]|nr:kinase-like domain-containing protein [Hyaloraphidium curvatum]